MDAGKVTNKNGFREMSTDNSIAKVKNPLTMVSVFAAISEVAMAYVITTLPDKLQEIFIWFVMGFPTVLVFIFFFILYKKPAVFFSPGDYKKEELYVSSIGLSGPEDSSRLKKLEDTVEILEGLIEKAKSGINEPAEYEKVRKEIQMQQDLQENPLYSFMTRDLKIAHEAAQRLIAEANDVWELPQLFEKESHDQRKTLRFSDLIRAFPSTEMDFQKIKPFIQKIGDNL